MAGRPFPVRVIDSEPVCRFFSPPFTNRTASFVLASNGVTGVMA